MRKGISNILAVAVVATMSMETVQATWKTEMTDYLNQEFHADPAVFRNSAINEAKSQNLHLQAAVVDWLHKIKEESALAL